MSCLPSRCGYLSVIARTDRVYCILLLNLPNCYAARARRYTTTVSHIAFISLLIDEWKTYTVVSAFWLSSVLLPKSPFRSVADRHCSIVFAILEFQDAASDHMAMQILGHVCMACTAMTFLFSSLLVVVFRAHRADLEVQDVITNISPLFEQPIRWNIHATVALPAVWTA